MYQNISGPVFYKSYKICDKNVFMFGDFHFSLQYKCEKNKNSLELNELIVNLSNTHSDKMIDFYMEVPYHLIENDGENVEKLQKYVKNYLSFYVKHNLTNTNLLKIAYFFEKHGCFTKNRKRCEKKYPNIRFHSSDFRDSKCNKNFILLYNFINNLNYDIVEGNKINSKKYLEYLKKVDTINKILNFAKDSLKCKKMKNQFNKIDKKYSNKILKMINDKLKYLQKTYKNNWKECMDSIKLFLKNKKKYDGASTSLMLGKMEDIITPIEALIMDAYLLARIFKNYSKNIFIYAGNAHINTYVNLFEKYLKVEPDDIGILNKLRCVKIKKIKL